MEAVWPYVNVQFRRHPADYSDLVQRLVSMKYY
jgi:hypothetical protein